MLRKLMGNMLYQKKNKQIKSHGTATEDQTDKIFMTIIEVEIRGEELWGLAGKLLSQGGCS